MTEGHWQHFAHFALTFMLTISLTIVLSQIAFLLCNLCCVQQQSNPDRLKLGQTSLLSTSQSKAQLLQLSIPRCTGQSPLASLEEEPELIKPKMFEMSIKVELPQSEESDCLLLHDTSETRVDACTAWESTPKFSM